MGNYVKAVARHDVADGSVKHIHISGKDISIARVGNEYFAIDDTCTHEQCSLGDEGFLDGSTVTCGCHGAQFDVTSGHVLSLPASRDLKTYKTKTEGSDILVEI